MPPIVARWPADIAAFDVTDSAMRCEQRVDASSPKHGGIDILVNNAGIQRRAPFVDFTQKDWDDIIATNLTAPFVVSQAVLPRHDREQARQDHSHRLADERSRAPDRRALHGRQGRRAAVDARHGHRARAARHPGQRDRARLLRHRNEPRADRQRGFNAWVCKRTPAGRWGEPAELAGLAVFSRVDPPPIYMTGQIVRAVAGGHNAAQLGVRSGRRVLAARRPLTPACGDPFTSAARRYTTSLAWPPASPARPTCFRPAPTAATDTRSPIQPSYFKLVESRKGPRVVDLAHICGSLRAGTPAIWKWPMCGSQRRILSKVALDDLRVIEVHLHAQVGHAHLLADRVRFRLRREEVVAAYRAD